MCTPDTSPTPVVPAPYTPPVYAPGIVPPAFPGGGARPVNPTTGYAYYYSNEPKPTNTGYHIIPGSAPVAPAPAPRPVAPPVYTPIPMPTGPTPAQIAAANAKAVAAGQVMYQQQQAAAAAAAAANASKASADYAAYVASQAAQPAGVTTAAPTPAPTMHQQPGTGLWVSDSPASAPAGVTTAAPPPPPPPSIFHPSTPLRPSAHVTVPTYSYATFPKPAYKPPLDAVQTMPPPSTYRPPTPVPKPVSVYHPISITAPTPPVSRPSASSVAAQIKNLQDRIADTERYGGNTSVLEQQLYKLENSQYSVEPSVPSTPVSSAPPAPVSYFHAATTAPVKQVSSAVVDILSKMRAIKATLQRWNSIQTPMTFGDTVIKEGSSLQRLQGSLQSDLSSIGVSTPPVSHLIPGYSDVTIEGAVAGSTGGSDQNDVQHMNDAKSYFQQQIDQIDYALNGYDQVQKLYTDTTAKVSSSVKAIVDAASTAWTAYRNYGTAKATIQKFTAPISSAWSKAPQALSKLLSSGLSPSQMVQVGITGATSGDDAAQRIATEMAIHNFSSKFLPGQTAPTQQDLEEVRAGAASAAQVARANFPAFKAWVDQLSASDTASATPAIQPSWLQPSTAFSAQFTPSTPPATSMHYQVSSEATGAPGETGQTGQTEPLTPPIPPSWLQPGLSPFTAQITRKTITTQSFAYDPVTKLYRLQEQTVYADDPNMLVKPPTWVPDTASSTPAIGVSPWSPSDFFKTVKDVWNASPYQPPATASSQPSSAEIPSVVPVLATGAANAELPALSPSAYDFSVAGKESAQDLAQISSNWAQRAGAALPPGMSAPYNQLEWQSPGAMVEPLATVGQDVQDLGEQYITAKRGLTPYPSYIGPYENVALKVIPPKELLIKGGQLVEQAATFLTPAEKAKAMGWILDVNGNLVGVTSGWTMETANAVLKQPLTATQLSELWFAGQGGNTALIQNTIAPYGSAWQQAVQVSPETQAAVSASTDATTAASSFLNTMSKAGQYIAKVPGGSKALSIGSAVGQKALGLARVLSKAAVPLQILQGIYDTGRITYAVRQAEDAMTKAQSSQFIDQTTVEMALDNLTPEARDALTDNRRLRQLVNGYTAMVNQTQAVLSHLPSDSSISIDDSVVNNTTGEVWVPHGFFDRNYVDWSQYHQVQGPQTKAAIAANQQQRSDAQALIQKAQDKINALTQLQQAKLEAGLP